jgi:hypothetical protein
MLPLSAFSEPGSSLVYLILEKTFQVSTSISRVSPTFQQEYRDALIQPKGNPTSQVQQSEEIEKENRERSIRQNG